MNTAFYVALVVFAVLVIYCLISSLMHDAVIKQLLNDVATLEHHINELSCRIKDLENKDT